MMWIYKYQARLFEHAEISRTRHLVQIIKLGTDYRSHKEALKRLAQKNYRQPF